MMRGKRWTEDEKALVREIYPKRGIDGCVEALPDRSRAAIAQIAFGLGLAVEINPKRRWTAAEVDILERTYPVQGAEACAALLPSRNILAIRQQAIKRGMKYPLAVPAGRRPPLEGKDMRRALDLRRQGWSYARIGREFGVCESTATNAITYAECVAAGRTPAKRDDAGGLLARDVQRLREMLLAGTRHVEIQRQMGISASCISHHRRRLEADLKAQRKLRLLPAHGGGETYSGRKHSPALKREAEALFLQGYGSAKISEKTGISHSQCLRIRSRLVRRLARKGQTLPGCDAAGRRRVIRDSVSFIPPDLVAELRRRLLAREPVARAANELAIGKSSAYRIRDQLAAELSAKGEHLPPPDRGGRSPAALKAARKAKWLPAGAANIYRYRALCREHGADRAKEILLAELAAARRAEAARPKSFEERLAAARAGARLVSNTPLHRADPSFTLGGVATGAL